MNRSPIGMAAFRAATIRHDTRAFWREWHSGRLLRQAREAGDAAIAADQERLAEAWALWQRESPGATVAPAWLMREHAQANRRHRLGYAWPPAATPVPPRGFRA